VGDPFESTSASSTPVVGPFGYTQNPRSSGGASKFGNDTSGFAIGLVVNAGLYSISAFSWIVFSEKNRT
jgi:hypothetical protein